MSEKVTKSNDTVKTDNITSHASPKHKNNMSGMKRRPQIKSGKSPLSIAKRLMGEILKEYKLHCIIVLICIFGSAFANVKGTLFMQKLIDDYIVPMLNNSSKDFGPLAAAIGKIAIIYGIGVVMMYAYNRIMVNVTQGTMKRIRQEMFEHMESLPIKYFDTHAHGDIMSIYTNDTDTLRQMIGQSLPQLINSVVSIINVLISMIILNIPLTVITLVMVSFMLFTTKNIAGKSGKFFVKQQKDLGTVNGYIEEMMEGQKVVKVFCHEEESKERFNELNDELFDAANKANAYANILMPINVNLGNLSYVVCAIVGCILGIKGISGMTLGTLASFLTLNKSFNHPISQISMQLNSVVMALAGADRIFTLLDEEPEVDNGYVTLVNAKEDSNGNITECEERTGMWAWKHPHSADGSVTYTELTGDVRFEDVTFGYNEDKTILHDISLFAKPGQKLAFVGSTGAGKTTITNLINRFYDIQDGKIRYDGINIKKIKKDDLRRSLGIVLQDTHLFTGTIKDNIRYGNLGATDEQVYEAAKLAHADQFIKMLPDGYDTVISGDGEGLSQGQRQLLSIARAAVANPPVLILDEATSSIDTRTESIVQRGMDNLMKGRTVFVIAHRLSTIRNSDAIIVLEHGKIIERGDHEDLIKNKGTYYQLYTGKLELS